MYLICKGLSSVVAILTFGFWLVADSHWQDSDSIIHACNMIGRVRLQYFNFKNHHLTQQAKLPQICFVVKRVCRKTMHKKGTCT